MTGNGQYDGTGPQLVPGQYGFTGAPGTAPDRQPPPDDFEVPGELSGIPNVGVQMALSDQVGYGEGLSSTQPGQTGTSAISPGPADGYTDTGAGDGRAVIDSATRYSWQQEAG